MMNKWMLSVLIALTLGAGVTVAQQSGGGGSSGGGGAVGAFVQFLLGTRITEVSDGVLGLTNSGGSTFTRLRFGTAGTQPEFLVSANVFRLGNVSAGGMALGFEGVSPPASCSSGDLWGGARTVLMCNGFGNFKPLGATSLPTSPIGGTGPTITPAALTGGNATFVFTVGTGGVATQIAFTLEAAQTGYMCEATNITANAAHVANQRVVQLSSTTLTAVMENQLVSTGAATAFAASDEVRVSCHQY